MGINVEITSVDAQGSNITFNQDGESRSMPVVLPAQIKWAKPGKAEIGISNEGKVNFIKSLEPRPAPTYGQGGYKKPESNIRAVSTLKVLEGVSPAEIVAVYDNINATNNTKCGASTMFQRQDGKYDAFLYITTFVPKDSPVADSIPEESVI